MTSTIFRVVAAYFIFIVAVHAAIRQGPVVDAITYSSVRVTWVTDAPSTTTIRYGPTSAYEKTTAGPASVTAHSWFISGLAPSTTYHFQACSAPAIGGAETCSPDRVFTTVARPSQSLPEAPRATVDVSMPAGPWGAPYEIAQNCSNLRSVLTSLANLTGNLNYEVRIPARTECRGQFVFPKRPNHTGWIVVRSASSLPEGIRVTTGSGLKMALFRTDALPAVRGHLNFIPETCSPDALFSAFNVPDMSIFVCAPQGGTGTAKSISAISATPGGALVTVPGHAYKTGNVVKVTNTRAGVDGTWRIKVMNAGQLLLEGAPAPSFYTAGGSVTRNESWTQVPHQSGNTLPTSCAVNSWFYKTDKPPEEAAYWCTLPNVWTNVRLIFTPLSINYAAIQFEDGAQRYRFIGLEITHNPVPNPPPAGWSASDYNQASVGALIGTKESNSHIIFDRCHIHGLDYPARLAKGIQLDGSHVALIHSRLHKVNRWLTNNDGVNMESIGINIGAGPGPGKIENNYIEAIGINLFFPDGSYHRTPAADYEIRSNYFAHSNTYLYGSPYNISRKNYMNRHHLELKKGRRMLVEGNIFDTNWADINQGAFIALSPRPGFLPPSKTITNVSYGTVTVSSDLDPYKAGMLVSLAGTGSGNHDGIWHIASVPTPTTFRLATGPPGIGATGLSSAVASDMQVCDIDIRNNIFRYGPNVLWITGHQDSAGGTLNTKTTQRIAFRNNLVHNIDARAGTNGGWSSPISRFSGNIGRPGIIVYAALGVEDLSVLHNTIYDVKGVSPTFLFFGGIQSGTNAGLRVQNNIFAANLSHVAQISGTYFGVNALNAGWTSYQYPSWLMDKNVFCCSASASMNALIPPFNSLPATIGAIGLSSVASGDYSLLSSSPYSVGKTCFGITGDCTNDGKNPGVDFNQLRAVLTPDERH